VNTSENKLKDRIGKCRCGHSGDASDSDHVDVTTLGFVQRGHGHCTKCTCKQFTWVGLMEK